MILFMFALTYNFALNFFESFFQLTDNLGRQAFVGYRKQIPVFFFDMLVEQIDVRIRMLAESFGRLRFSSLIFLERPRHLAKVVAALLVLAQQP